MDNRNHGDDYSVPGWDLYVVYEGTNPDTDQPIIKALLNPLVAGSGPVC